MDRIHERFGWWAVIVAEALVIYWLMAEPPARTRKIVPVPFGARSKAARVS